MPRRHHRLVSCPYATISGGVYEASHFVVSDLPEHWLGLPPVVPAQVAEPIGVHQGERVRIAPAEGPPVVGSFLRATPDTIQLLDPNGRAHGVTASGIRSVDVSLGRPIRSGRVAKGALVGAAILGGATTAMIGLSDPGWKFVGLALFAPIGGVVGAFVAAHTAPEEWQSVPVAALSVNPSRSAGSTIPVIRPANGNGRRIALGALMGGIAGAAFAATERSSRPAANRVVKIMMPGILLGGAVGALMH